MLRLSTFGLALFAGICAAPNHCLAQSGGGDEDNGGADGPGLVLHVATFGMDSWPGTATQPFLTLYRARMEIRMWKAAYPGQQTSITVKIAGGEHELTAPEVFEPADSGWANNPIQYIAWNPARPGMGDNEDALITGGIALTGWQGGANGIYYCQVPTGVPDVRDVWVNNQRMIKGRFPNAPQPCTVAQTNPTVAPCPNQGYLVLKQVQAVTDLGQRRQRITIRTPDNTTQIVAPADWSKVEVNGTRGYANPHQRASSGFRDPVAQHLAVIDFNLTGFSESPANPNWPLQDLGGLGCFYYENWNSGEFRTDAQSLRSYLQMVGEDNGAPQPPVPARLWPAQVFLSNDVNFVDDAKEWYYNPATRTLYLKACRNPSLGDRVIVPIAEQLLVVKTAEHLRFQGLDFAYTHQPMPKMADNTTPGYVSIQSGLEWHDEPESRPWAKRDNNIVSAVVTLLGAQDVTLRECRIAHAGGSGLVIGSHNPCIDENCWVESNNCEVRQCEIFDVGGHGVYLGDERADEDEYWPTNSSAALSAWYTINPSHNLTVQLSKIENFAVVYRDSVGIYAAHTHDLSLLDNEISYGNYTGVSIGNRQAHLTVNTRGTKIARNDIHHVMLKLVDGGALYLQGSNPASATRANSGEINANHVHDIVLNPYLNNQFGDVTCKAFYFETGSDSWHVLGNYVERCQGPYSFSPAGVTGACLAPNYGFHDLAACNQGAAVWFRQSWPQPYTFFIQTDIAQYIPGQTWYPGTPNYWFSPVAGAHKQFADCAGYGYSDPGHARHDRLGMYDVSGALGSGEPNIVLSSANSVTDPITSQAGPKGTTNPANLNWFFPSTVDRIHRSSLCGQSYQDPATQIQ
jgi:hypothetical protein